MNNKLNLFSNHTQYSTFAESTSIRKPNISYCIEEDEVHYNVNANRLIVVFNITDPESLEYPKNIALRLNTISSIEIDGILYTDLESINYITTIYSSSHKESECYYSFDKIGIHTIKYELESNTVSINSALGYDYDLMMVIIPDNIEVINEYFADDCENLKYVKIPNSINSVSHHVFTNCPSLPTEGYIRYADTIAVECIDKTKTTYTLKNGTKIISPWLFQNCSNLTSFVIPNTITSYGLGNMAFRNCSSLTSITIPKQIKTIDNATFANCTSLTTVIFENGSELEQLNGGVFNGCSSLQHLEFPSTLNLLWNAEFSGCTSLENITFHSVVPPTLKDGTIITSSQTFTIYVPSESVNAYKTAERWSVAASRIQAIS